VTEKGIVGPGGWRIDFGAVDQAAGLAGIPRDDARTIAEIMARDWAANGTKPASPMAMVRAALRGERNANDVHAARLDKVRAPAAGATNGSYGSHNRTRPPSGGAGPRDQSEKFADYAARMEREGKYRRATHLPHTAGHFGTGGAGPPDAPEVQASEPPPPRDAKPLESYAARDRMREQWQGLADALRKQAEPTK
jgi:hypothetical protein